ncbi:MAG TPA: GNAT family protein [Paracoccaceae bacterium]|nr:GNAT family protein [Paracoccaceae bacterium]HMO72576.1 GNAT family protein [Paracoccaceae bacterium]
MPPRAPLQGAWVRLEPLEPAHAPDLWSAVAGHDSLWDYMPYGPFATAGEHAAWIAAQAASRDPLFFALVDRSTGKAGGVASWLRIAPAAGSIEIGHICLGPRIAGSRAATEAWAQMMGWAFGAGYRRVEWKCNAANLPSRRAAQRLGMAFEGVHRQAAVVKGRNRDTAWFSVIDGEWPALRAALAEWLSPANFDADGRQRKALSGLTRPLLAAADPALSE